MPATVLVLQPSRKHASGIQRPERHSHEPDGDEPARWRRVRLCQRSPQPYEDPPPRRRRPRTVFPPYRNGQDAHTVHWRPR